MQQPQNSGFFGGPDGPVGGRTAGRTVGHLVGLMEVPMAGRTVGHLVDLMEVPMADRMADLMEGRTVGRLEDHSEVPMADRTVGRTDRVVTEEELLEFERLALPEPAQTVPLARPVEMEVVWVLIEPA